MKHLNFVLLFLFVCLMAFADDNKKDNNNEKKQPTTYQPFNLRKGLKDPMSRPGAPDRQRVSCSYDGETIVIDFYYPEGDCLVTVTDLYTGMTQCHSDNSSDLEISVPVGEIFESSIEVSTEKGNKYIGLLLSEESGFEE